MTTDAFVPLVPLESDHPGFADPVYRRRRDAIARLALGHSVGAPLPSVVYTDDEHRVWRTVRTALAPRHAALACRRYRDAASRLSLPVDRVPQLADISARTEALGGFRLEPVAGLVEGRTFLGRLAEGVFLSTQYLRHSSRPLYTPEPDWIHEAVGHTVLLADPRYARLHRMFGRVARAISDPGRLARLDRFYWFTLEFGLVLEGGQPRAVGAGLLSSVAELDHAFESAQHLAFDAEAMMEQVYDPTVFQERLFVAPGWGPFEEAIAHALARV